jgi:feruloyl esterase
MREGIAINRHLRLPSAWSSIHRAAMTAYSFRLGMPQFQRNQSLNRMLRILFAFLVSGVLIYPLGRAGAQESTLDILERACWGDYVRHCSAVERGEGRIPACLTANRNSLLAPCRDALSAIEVAIYRQAEALREPEIEARILRRLKEARDSTKVAKAPAQSRPADVKASVCNLTALPSLPDVTISLAAPAVSPVKHCKIVGVIGRKIHFELLLPEKWNGKFVMGGGGGFVGSVMNTSLMYGSLQSGYATVGTDTGHQAHPVDASWALNDLEALVNFGHLAVHRTAVTAKALINAFYKAPISRSYFTGCSRGGGQAIMSALRYPEDFDAVAAGAYAIDWTGIAVQATQINQAMYPDPKKLEQAVVGPKAQALIERSYLAACDGLDGLKDGILNDPRQCTFDVASLQCDAGKSDDCLSTEELAAVKVIYDGPKDAKGNSLYYGFPFGGESSPNGWSRWLTGGLKFFDGDFQEGVGAGGFAAPISPSAFYSFGNGIMQSFVYHDPKWTYKNFKFSTYAQDSAAAAETLNATNPDLSAFRARGGKMLLYSGWSDTAQSGLAMVGYYESVLARDKTARQDVRLFMMPGVEHCFGGPGPSWVNYLDEIDKWVTTGKAPNQIVAYWLNKEQKPTGSRLICAHPKTLKYSGSGNPREASSFKCEE